MTWNLRPTLLTTLRTITRTLLLCACLHSPLASATLSIEKTPGGFTLSTPQNSAVYYYLQQSTDLKEFHPFSMALGDTASEWPMTYEVRVSLPLLHRCRYTGSMCANGGGTGRSKS